MNIGILILLLLSSVVGYSAWNAYHTVYKPAPTPIVFGQQVGRTKHIQSKSGDASMFTQNARRTAIIAHRFKDTFDFPKKAIRETRTSSGSYTGALETFMISFCCKKQPVPTLPDIIDGGDAFTTVYEYVIDGGDAFTSIYDYVVDAGTA